MDTEPYFQFPLCALAFGKTVDERLNAITDYCVVETGSKMLGKLSADQQRDFFKQAVNHQIRSGISAEHGLYRAAIYGSHVLGITYGHFDDVLGRHKAMRIHICNFVSSHGSDAQVRIKTSWLFKARDGRGLTYREFSVLCGIYSAIGDKKLAIVTRERIRRCALGYRTSAIMHTELSKRADKGQPLTERQLRDTIERLHQNKFFARCTFARRITYYSIRLEDEELRKAVLERRIYRDFFHASHSAKDKLLTDAIKQKRRELAKREPRAPSTPRLNFTPPPEQH